MNDRASARSLLLAGPLLALLCACPIAGTLGVYRTDGATMVTEAATTDAATSQPTSGDSDGMNVCQQAGDDACSSCLRSSCCDAPACADPPGCNCMFACIQAGTAAKDCVEMCTPDAHAKEFSQCAMKYCAATCEGAAP